MDANGIRLDMTRDQHRLWNSGVVRAKGLASGRLPETSLIFSVRFTIMHIPEY